jgi:hypothetical protein
MGPTALLLLRRKLCYGFLSPLKIHWPRPGLNPRTLGPVASTLTTSPPRVTVVLFGVYLTAQGLCKRSVCKLQLYVICGLVYTTLGESSLSADYQGSGHRFFVIVLIPSYRIFTDQLKCPRNILPLWNSDVLRPHN